MKALKLNGTDKLYVHASHKHGIKYYVNDVDVTNLIENGMIIKQSDKFEKLDSSLRIKEYRDDDDNVLTIKEYQNLIKYVDDDDDDETILEALTCRKKRIKYHPVHCDIKKEIEPIEVVGVTQDTKSKFISCSVTLDESKDDNGMLYWLNLKAVAEDEYSKLKDEYKSHTTFENKNNTIFKYLKVNGHYVFTNGLFSDDALRMFSFITLKDAQQKEYEMRTKIRKVVKNAVFPPSFSKVKADRVLTTLKIIKNVKQAKVKDNLLDELIDNIQEYVDMIKD